MNNPSLTQRTTNARLADLKKVPGCPGGAPRRPNVLYLVHRVPYPPDKGDRIRTYHLLRYLARRSAVHLACLADEPVPQETLTVLRGVCARLAVVPLGKRTRLLRAAGSFLRGRTISEGVFHSPALVQVLGDWARETPFHVALASASSLIPYLRSNELRQVPAVVDLIDVDSQKWFDYAAAGGGLRALLYRTEGRRLRALEQTLPLWARAATVVSEPEADLFQQFCPWAGIHAVANGVDLDYFRPPTPVPAENGCVFVGALDYPPNVDAACWFGKEVLPLIHRRHPGACLRLVGRQPLPEVRRLANVPGIEVVGQVPDVRPYVAGAAVAVVPLRIARGLQNKVLEAMAMGKPVVASPQALTALRDKPDLPALTAAEPREWVEQVTHLLDNTSLRRELGTAGRRYVEASHDWERCLEPFEALLGLETDDPSACAAYPRQGQPPGQPDLAATGPATGPNIHAGKLTPTPPPVS
jgi:polysaccharide biosynthesis protein PslH